MGRRGALAGRMAILLLLLLSAMAPPQRAVELYNEACARCNAGEIDAAARLVLDAIRAGFDDISHLRRDADLRALREHPVFRAVVAAQDAADPMIVERRLARWRDAHPGDDYRYATDEARGILLPRCEAMSEGGQLPVMVAARDFIAGSVATE